MKPTELELSLRRVVEGIVPPAKRKGEWQREVNEGARRLAMVRYRLEGPSPRWKPTGKLASQRELAEFAKRIAAVQKQLDAMHEQARDAIDPEDDLAGYLETLGRRVSAASSRFEQEPATFFKSGGAPKKPYAREVRERAGEVYRKLTGKRDTINTRTVAMNEHQLKAVAYGSFNDFLSHVLRTMNIKASAAFLGKQRKQETGSVPTP